MNFVLYLPGVEKGGGKKINKYIILINTWSHVLSMLMGLVSDNIFFHTPRYIVRFVESVKMLSYVNRTA